jgi:2-(1,2-epoxy-1,2-dihydrophenyl)acetyl-CoA isomerase
MPEILVERGGGVVTMTLNQPAKKNAINDRMWAALAEALDGIEASETDRVLVLRGAGENFSSGADLTNRDSREHPLLRMRHIGDVAVRLHTLSIPAVAAVDGVAVGAGLNIALGCDLVVATDRARFSEIFARRGLSLDVGGSWLLPRLVGLRKAKELALLAEIIPAADAAELGLVNRVVGVEELDGVVEEWTRKLAEGPPIALASSKRLLNESSSVTMAQALESEARAQVVNFYTEDTTEAFTAFAEKREPSFTGRAAPRGVLTGEES